MVTPVEDEPTPEPLDAPGTEAAEVDARARAAEDPPAHEAVEGPEESLESVRDEAHQEAGEVEDLRERLAASEAREAELKDRLARALADFENFRRRSREESAQAAGRGKESMLAALLPVLDNLDRALAHSEDQGLRMVMRQLHDILAAQGVQVIDPQDEAFDAKRHEAIAQEEREGAKSGTVVAVVEKGYAYDGRVLRPARVVVAP